ncbi:hypothetical protein Mapa_004034 [Marchantia paleacea]|nr:hypothetical protein Mapa_004034 [Marchantia paleacea]
MLLLRFVRATSLVRLLDLMIMRVLRFLLCYSPSLCSSKVSIPGLWLGRSPLPSDTSTWFLPGEDTFLSST